MKTKILQKTFLSIAVGFAAALAPVTAHAQRVVAFEGHFENPTVVSVSCNGGVCDFVFQGTGNVNIMGAVTWTVHVTQDFNGYPCDTAHAEGTAVGATGSISVSDICGVVCPSTSGPDFLGTISSVWNVTGGTGEFSGIIGSGTNQGTDTGHGPNVHLSGTVAY